MDRRGWLAVAAGALIVVGIVYVGTRGHGQVDPPLIARQPAHSAAVNRTPADAVLARMATPAPSPRVDCAFVSLTRRPGLVILGRACVKAATTTIEYPVAAGAKTTIVSATALACRAYVGTSADHEWLNTYVAPHVRAILLAAGGRCKDWLALASSRPPAGHLQTRSSAAVLYSGG